MYKRPIAIFFFPEPPPETDPRQEFRTLPDFEIEKLSSDTRYAIRQAEAMQTALREINDGTNPSKDKRFRDIKATPSSSASDLARAARNYLDIVLSDQAPWNSREEALENWRKLVQDRGVFIFKRSFKQGDVSGFSLDDEEFSVIYLNNNTAAARQIFTLFHELAHIMLHSSGITKQNDRYIGSLTGPPKAIEVFCNQFAGEFLVPSDDFENRIRSGPYDDRYLSNLADRYLVSREVILRKLLDRGYVDRSEYDTKAEKWNREYLKRRSTQRGGDYYANQATYLGEKYLRLAFARYYKGQCTLERLADYLNCGRTDLS